MKLQSALNAVQQEVAEHPAKYLACYIDKVCQKMSPLLTSNRKIHYGNDEHLFAQSNEGLG